MASVVQQMRFLSIQNSVALPVPPLKTNKVSMFRSVSCTSSLYASATVSQSLKLKQTHNRFCYLTSVTPLNPRRTAPFIVQPIAGRVCRLTGKKSNNANKVSFSQKKTKKLQKVNLQAKKLWWEAGKRMVKLRISTKALRTIAKKGLDAMAKEAGIDLRKL